MKHLKTRVVIFTMFSALGAILAWLSGYNFDERNTGVALYFGTVLTFAALSAAFPLD